MTKQKTLPNAVGGAHFDFTKAFSYQLVSRVRLSQHQYSITNQIEKLLKVKKT